MCRKMTSQIAESQHQIKTKYAGRLQVCSFLLIRSWLSGQSVEIMGDIGTSAVKGVFTFSTDQAQSVQKTVRFVSKKTGIACLRIRSEQSFEHIALDRC